MGRPANPPQQHGFQRPTASSLAGTTKGGGSGGGGGGGSSGGGGRAPTTAAELLAPWQAKAEAEQLLKRRQGLRLDVRTVCRGFA